MFETQEDAYKVILETLGYAFEESEKEIFEWEVRGSQIHEHAMELIELYL